MKHSRSYAIIAGLTYKLIYKVIYRFPHLILVLFKVGNISKEEGTDTVKAVSNCARRHS